MKTVLAIPDIHFPAHHPDVFDFLKAIKAKYKPTDVICLGDEIDAAALGEWDKDPDAPGAGAELTQSILQLKKLYAIFPNVKVCVSNHTDRIYRRAFKAGLPKRLMRTYREILEAPKGWSWSEYWEVDGIRYEHGEGFSGQQGAIKAAMQNMQPTVIGHLHSHAGIQYYANAKYLIWGFNAGCLIDHKNPAFNYAKNTKAKPIIGVGIIMNRIPLFVPMTLSKNGRWTRQV
jgi:predicted phosphodiesterase